MTTRELWQKLLSELGCQSLEFPTTPKQIRTHIWFSAKAVDSCIYVGNAKEHTPSRRISGARILTFTEFERIYPIYLKRENGERVSAEATRASVNQVYWYSLIKHCC